MKHRKIAVLAAVFLLVCSSQNAWADEKQMNVSLDVSDSYSVTIPEAVSIIPATDYRLNGEYSGTAEGGFSSITAQTNTLPGYQVVVRVKADSFNGSNTIDLINETNNHQVLTTQLSVCNRNESSYQALSKNNNVAAAFSGRTGDTNEQITGGSLFFSAPAEAKQSSGEYSGQISFVVTYEKK